MADNGRRKENRMTPERLIKICEAYSRGDPYPHIEARWGISRQNIRGVMADHGYPERPRRHWECVPDKERKEWIAKAKAYHAQYISQGPSDAHKTSIRSAQISP